MQTLGIDCRNLRTMKPTNPRFLFAFERLASLTWRPQKKFAPFPGITKLLIDELDESMAGLIYHCWAETTPDLHHNWLSRTSRTADISNSRGDTERHDCPRNRRTPGVWRCALPERQVRRNSVSAAGRPRKGNTWPVRSLAMSANCASPAFARTVRPGTLGLLRLSASAQTGDGRFGIQQDVPEPQSLHRT